MPKFQLEEPEDYYTYYVDIMEVPLEIFLDADIHTVERIARNKSAFNNWKDYALDKMRERENGKK